MAQLAGSLSSFGLPLGEAFQLRDDLLGVFGDPAVTGKPVGDDLREGKPTLLAGLARRAPSERTPACLSERFGAADLTEAEVHELRAVIEATGARPGGGIDHRELAAAADAALAALPILPPSPAALRELAAFATGRDH